MSIFFILIGFFLYLIFNFFYCKIFFFRKTNWRKGLIKKKINSWGTEELWAESNSYSSKILSLKRGISLEYTGLLKKEKSILIISGKILLNISSSDRKSTQIILSPGETFHLYPTANLILTTLTNSKVLEITNKKS